MAETVKARKFWRQTVLGGAVLGLAFSGYLLVLKWRGPAAALITQLPGEDGWVPFAPVWLYVYLAPYPLGPPLLGLLTWDSFVWYLRRGLLAMAISLVVFCLLPTHTVRPAPSVVDDLGDDPTARFYRQMIAVDDPPANAAPSLHISLSTLLGLALWRDFPRWRVASAAGVGLVWLATLFTWQHHVIDVATGALLAGLLAWIPERQR